MTIRQQMQFWGIGAAVTLLLLWVLADVLFPFVAGAALAYLLDPLADRLERAGLSRLLAVGLLFLVFLLLLVLGLLVLLPLTLDQLRDLIANAPSYAEKLRAFVVTLGHRYAPESFADGAAIEQSLDTLIIQAKSWSGQLAQGAWSSGLAIMDALLLLVITPVVTFYLLLDWDHLIARLRELLPRQHAPVITDLARQVDDVLSAFVRGQIMVCLILGLFYATALSLAGLDFALPIGLFAGLISFIPYVGSALGLVLSMGVGLFQFWPDATMIGVIAGIFAFGQVIEGNVLSPKIVGDSVGLHPVALLFALAAFGKLMGFTGLLIAVPTAAAIGVLARYGVGLYKRSRVYLGASPHD